MIDQAKKLCQLFRLFGFHEHLEHRVHEAEASQLGHADFLQCLLEDESIYRKVARGKRLISRAKFRHDFDLEDWDDSFDRGLNRAKLKELATLGFLKQKANLIILGKTGEGKTHLAMSLGKRLCSEGFATHFFSVNLFLEEIQASKASCTYLKFIKKQSSASVLVLDDLGLRPYSHEEATCLMDIIEERYQKGITIITSQVDPKG